MTDTSPRKFDDIVRELSSCGSSRTWSILVTIFGDLAQNSDDEISGPLLSSLTQMIGIKPQAMRVALHRLRRDGWIVTKKSGRTSRHRLSDYGLEQSAIASPRIYSREIKTPDIWHVIITDPDAQSDEKSLVISGYRKILSEVYIGSGTGPVNTEGALVISGNISKIPDWLQTSIAKANTCEEYSDFNQSLVYVKQVLNGGYKPTPMETAVIRTLIVHNWRRIVLRQPDMSVELLPNSPSSGCRNSVWELLEQLTRPGIKAMEAS